MDHTQLMRIQFGREESKHALLDEANYSQPALGGRLINAIDDMLRQAIAERDVSVSRSTVGIAVRRNNDFQEDMRAPDDHARTRAYQQKKRCFAVGRMAARAALEEIGLNSFVSIGRGARGEPLWPQGFSGSITHCFPWSIAVAARCAGQLAVGIDVEDVRRLHELSIADLICSAGERDWVSAGDPRTRLVMIFSAKEAIYKAFYPFLKCYIDFQDVELCWSDPHNCFQCCFVKQSRLGVSFTESFKVYCRRSGKFIISLMMCELAGIIDSTHLKNF